ncbi:non-ribosomal peptide synthetase, partial [Aphanizomenon flos-aquae]
MSIAIESIYPLSPMQQGMLFHSFYAPESGVYFQQMTLKLQGNIDVKAFALAWQKVVDRYSILRTFFDWENRQTPLQVVFKQVNLPWKNLDWRELSITEQQQKLSCLLLAEREQGFQFDQAPLMRCILIQLSDNSYTFIWNHHHILMDGWCLPIIFKDVLSFYETEITGKVCNLPTPRPYRDYIAWLNSQDKEAAREFWRQTLDGFIAPTPLVVHKTQYQNQQQGSNYSEVELRLSAKISSELQSVAKQNRVTLSTILQAVWALLLSRYSGETDVVFGVTVSGRSGSLSGVENMVGLLINTLPLRLQISPQEQLISWLQQIQQLMVELQHYSYTPLVDIQALSDLPGGIQLFESIVVVENYPIDSSLLNKHSSLKISEIEGFEQTNYPLTILVIPGSDLLVKISYDTALFEETTMGWMLGHLQTIFSAILENPSTTVGELPLLSAAERHQLLVEWNDTAAEYPIDKCIHQLFEEQVEKTPDAVAVVFGNQQLTYRELNQQANQLAHYLQTLGVRPEVLVGICVERSLEMVVGLLGILKAGGAYVPLDPNYPQERLSYMLVDSGVEVLLTQQQLMEKLPENNARLVCLDSDWNTINLESQENLHIELTGDKLAYVIYTSGSTGQPKGVAVSHQAINRLVLNTNYVQLRSDDRIAQAANASFDAATFEIWGALLNGAILVGVTQSIVLSPAKFAAYLREQQISVLFLTTALFNQLANFVPEAFNSLRYLLFGGEAVDPIWVREFLQNSSPQQLLHVYGPTENTTFSSWFLVENVPATATTIPIGRPISNTQLYILDSHHQPVPIGVPGELYIGGDGLARGYLNRPELTQEKFIPNPYGDRKSQRLYKTGDLARYLADGNIEFLGRIDNQVKIRGFRIELGEIEAVLNTHPHIQQAVVIAIEDIRGNKSLVAYLVKSDEFLTNKQIRDFLKQQLPEYMLPSVFVTLDTIPLTPNGKIDKKALPIPDGVSREVEYIAPRTPSEEIIANIFATVLNQQNIGINDNFFSLGGHSLLATQLISRLRLAFNVEIPLRAVFESPTVTQLDIAIAQLRSQERGLILPPIQAIEGDREQLPLSWAQERLWFLNQLEGASATYNIPAAVKIAGDLDINALQQALSEIVQRHEILRTSIQTVNGVPIQVIHPQVTTSINVVDLQQLLAPERETLLEQQIQLEASIPFNLENAPLIRCILLQVTDREYVLLLTMHHIVSDGWSMGIFISELSSLYPAFCAGEPSPLPELPLQYADFAVWQRQWLSGVVLETQLNYWRSQLQGS